MKLLWITDLHLMSAGASHKSGVDPEGRLRRCIDHMIVNHSDAARLIISGDLIQIRNSEAYSLLASLLADINIPVRLLVGNHDDRAALTAAFPDVKLRDGFVQDAELLDGFELIYLDTLADGKHFGELCPQRLAWLEKSLAATNHRALLFMHHPPASVGIPALDKARLSAGDTEFAAILERYRYREPLLLCGHLHRSISGIWKGTPFVVMTTPHLGFALKMHEEKLIPVDENPGYGVILCEEDSVIVHTQSLPRE
ncbi:metallophosphoesterase [Caballeronia sp. LjRoot29]|uniref:metallophosphoesterase n=1 Tax=Caballeronia sp. LjRoot29 TaxID=3342315 RepID=UPI003ECCF741